MKFSKQKKEDFGVVAVIYCTFRGLGGKLYIRL